MQDDSLQTVNLLSNIHREQGATSAKLDAIDYNLERNADEYKKLINNIDLKIDKVEENLSNQLNAHDIRLTSVEDTTKFWKHLAYIIISSYVCILGVFKFGNEMVKFLQSILGI